MSRGATCQRLINGCFFLTRRCAVQEYFGRLATVSENVSNPHHRSIAPAAYPPGVHQLELPQHSRRRHCPHIMRGQLCWRSCIDPGRQTRAGHTVQKPLLIHAWGRTRHALVTRPPRCPRCRTVYLFCIPTGPPPSVVSEIPVVTAPCICFSLRRTWRSISRPRP